jgi:uncharacterized protein YjiS (DUF1127 family)
MATAIRTPGVAGHFSFSQLIARGAEMISLWQERAEGRQHLAALDDHMLADIGLTRAEAEQEANKPFWME